MLFFHSGKSCLYKNVKKPKKSLQKDRKKRPKNKSQNIPLWQNGGRMKLRGGKEYENRHSEVAAGLENECIHTTMVMCVGKNMTSCPAGSVSSSLDSLEKLFSLLSVLSSETTTEGKGEKT